MPQINWGKFKSMKRCHAMLCHVLELDSRAQTRPERQAVRAQIIQCLKALHEFAGQGDWRTAWPLTHLPDPVEAMPMAGTEVEMECILAALKTTEDLKERSRHSRHRSLHEQVSGDEEEPRAARAKPKPRPKPKHE